MSRIIKFRAWDEQDKIMWEPLTLNDLIRGKWELETPNQESSLPHKDYLDFAHNNTEWMQSLNITDKNGKEVFEKDLVKDQNDRIWLIVWDTRQARFFFQQKNAPKKEFDGRIGPYRVSVQEYLLKMGEVIGNIYTNPELIQQ